MSYLCVDKHQHNKTFIIPDILSRLPHNDCKECHSLHLKRDAVNVTHAESSLYVLPLVLVGQPLHSSELTVGNFGYTYDKYFHQHEYNNNTATSVRTPPPPPTTTAPLQPTTTTTTTQKTDAHDSKEWPLSSNVRAVFRDAFKSFGIRETDVDVVHHTMAFDIIARETFKIRVPTLCPALATYVAYTLAALMTQPLYSRHLSVPSRRTSTNSLVGPIFGAAILATTVAVTLKTLKSYATQPYYNNNNNNNNNTNNNTPLATHGQKSLLSIVAPLIAGNSIAHFFFKNKWLQREALYTRPVFSLIQARKRSIDAMIHNGLIDDVFSAFVAMQLVVQAKFYCHATILDTNIRREYALLQELKEMKNHIYHNHHLIFSVNHTSMHLCGRHKSTGIMIKLKCSYVSETKVHQNGHQAITFMVLKFNSSILQGTRGIKWSGVVGPIGPLGVAGPTTQTLENKLIQPTDAVASMSVSATSTSTTSSTSTTTSTTTLSHQPRVSDVAMDTSDSKRDVMAKSVPAQVVGVAGCTGQTTSSWGSSLPIARNPTYVRSNLSSSLPLKESKELNAPTTEAKEEQNCKTLTQSQVERVTTDAPSAIPEDSSNSLSTKFHNEDVKFSLTFIVQ